MDFITIIIIVLLSYVIIQLAIDRSINTKILKENFKVLVEIRELLKNKIKICNKVITRTNNLPEKEFINLSI